MMVVLGLITIIMIRADIHSTLVVIAIYATIVSVMFYKIYTRKKKQS